MSYTLQLSDITTASCCRNFISTNLVQLPNWPQGCWECWTPSSHEVGWKPHWSTGSWTWKTVSRGRQICQNLPNPSPSQSLWEHLKVITRIKNSIFHCYVIRCKFLCCISVGKNKTVFFSSLFGAFNQMIRYFTREEFCPFVTLFTFLYA